MGDFGGIAIRDRSEYPFAEIDAKRTLTMGVYKQKWVFSQGWNVGNGEFYCFASCLR
jgi:hypothetical protein